MYNSLLFSSENSKILFVVIKEARSSYVCEVDAIMYLGRHSSAHLLSKSTTYSDILTIIKSEVYAFTNLHFNTPGLALSRCKHVLYCIYLYILLYTSIYMSYILYISVYTSICKGLFAQQEGVSLLKKT